MLIWIRHTVLGAFFCLALTASAGGKIQGQTPKLPVVDRSALRQALDAYDRGDLKTAEPLLVALTVRYPTNYEANEALGSLYAETERTSAAIPFLKKACRIAPSEVIAHANLGAAYLKANRLAEAIAELRMAVKTDGKNPSTQSNLGQALILNKQPNDAAKAFAVAVEAMPEDAELRYDLALALYESGAVKDAGEALRGIPTGAATDQAEALNGEIAEKLGDYKAALVHYQAAARLNPSDTNIYALTMELLRHWTWDEAFKIASYGESRYPESRHFRVAEGIARYGGEKYADSAAIFSSLLTKEPENALFADLLGRSCSAIAEDAAVECSGLSEFAKTHPNNAPAAMYAAASLLHQPAAMQDKEKVKQLLTLAIKANPKLAEAHFQLAVLDQAQLQWTESVAELKTAVELRPAYSEAHYRLSRAYAHLGMRDEAQQEIDLQKKYSQQAKDTVNAHLQEVVTFLLTTN